MAKKGHRKQSCNQSSFWHPCVRRNDGSKWNCASTSWKWMLWLMHLHSTNTETVWIFYVWLSELMTLCILFFSVMQQTSSPLPPAVLNCWILGVLSIKKGTFAISHVCLTIILDPGCPSTDHRYLAVKTLVFSVRPKSHKCLLVEMEFSLFTYRHKFL